MSSDEVDGSNAGLLELCRVGVAADGGDVGSALAKTL